MKSAEKKDLQKSDLKKRLEDTGCRVFQLENVMRNTMVRRHIYICTILKYIIYEDSNPN